MVAPELVTPPGALFTLAEAKAHLRVEHDEEDAMIAAYLAAAVAHFDGYSGILGRCLLNQQWRVTLPVFPARAFLLPFPGVQIVSIAYFDANNVEQTLGQNDFFIGCDGVVHFLPETGWPASYARPDAVRITFTAGYGATPDKVPAPIRAAVLFKLGDLYARRDGGAGNEGVIMSLVAPYRLVL